MRIEAVVGLVVAVAASFSSRVEIVAAAALLACLVALVADRVALGRVLRLGLVVGAVFAAAVAGAAVAWASGIDRGVSVGATVLLRIIVLVTAAALVARSVDAEAVLRATSRLGMERLGLAFGLALNCLPHLSETAATVWAAHRVRSGGRLTALVRVPVLIEVLLAHTARVADRAAAAAALRGHTALAGPATAVTTAARTVVVTGPPGSGKTPVVTAAVDELVRRGLTVAGFVQPAIVNGSRKIGFRLRDVATGDEVPLAQRVATGSGSHGTSFEFDPAGFELAVRALARARDGSLLVIDELGPVELRGDGHWPAVRRAVASVALRAVVVVVRPSLVPSLLEALDAADVVVVDLESGAGRAVDRVVDEIVTYT